MNLTILCCEQMLYIFVPFLKVLCNFELKKQSIKKLSSFQISFPFSTKMFQTKRISIKMFLGESVIHSFYLSSILLPYLPVSLGNISYKRSLWHQLPGSNIILEGKHLHGLQEALAMFKINYTHTKHETLQIPQRKCFKVTQQEPVWLGNAYCSMSILVSGVVDDVFCVCLF